MLQVKVFYITLTVEKTYRKVKNCATGKTFLQLLWKRPVKKLKIVPQVNFFTLTVEKTYRKVKNCAARKLFYNKCGKDL